MIKVDESFIRGVEERYPGFRETLEYYESLRVPRCAACGSDATAKVVSGLIGRTMHLAAATTKVKLLPNGRPTDFFCTACDRVFSADSPASPK
jgi:hypothetical protein